MRVHHIVVRELAHRRGSFAGSLSAIAVAVACVTGCLTLLHRYDLQTQALQEARQVDLRARVAEMNEDIRRAMNHLGFNVVILPADQPLADWYADDYACKTMPETNANRLAAARLMTVEHFVPQLRIKAEWPETRQTVVLIGSGGKILRPSAEAREIVASDLPEGQVSLGYELWRSQRLNVGQSIRLKGREMTVAACLPEQGSVEDVAVRMNLRSLQELMGMPGTINEILALECRTAWGNLPHVRQEIQRVLPGTQVVERGSDVLAKTEARRKTEREGQAALAALQAERARGRAALMSLSWLLGTLAAVACAAWLALLAGANVRDRRAEVGILQAIGYSFGHILGIFVARAALLGLIGGAVGGWAGFALGHALLRSLPAADVVRGGLDIGAALGGAVVVSVCASWVPSLRAARLDPAVTLNGLP